jgi:hypothetical protein
VWHAAGGVERLLPGGMSVRLDGYYKRFADLIVGRLENDGQRLARLATYDVPASLSTYVPRDAQITVSPSNEGRGDARGLEVLVSRPAIGSSPVSLWASYSYGRARRTAYGVTGPFDYDRRHAFSVVGNARIGGRFDISATGRWASGLPRTPVRGVRLALGLDDIDSDGDGNRAEWLPLRDGTGNPYSKNGYTSNSRAMM